MGVMMGINIKLDELDGWGKETANDTLSASDIKDAFGLDDMKDQVETLLEDGKIAEATQLETQLLRMDALAEGMDGKTVRDIATEYVKHVGIADYQTDTRTTIAATLNIDESSIPTPEQVGTPALEFVEFGRALFSSESPYSGTLPNMENVYHLYTNDVSQHPTHGLNNIKYDHGTSELSTIDGSISGALPAGLKPSDDYEPPETLVAKAPETDADTSQYTQNGTGMGFSRQVDYLNKHGI